MLAKQLLDPREAAKYTVKDLTPSECKVMMEWYEQFRGKYPQVGELIVD